MNRSSTLAISFLMLLVTACAEPYDFDAVSPEQQQAWLDETARGFADGLDKTLPRGSKGIHARMGTVTTDVPSKTINVVVNVISGENQINNSTDDRNSMREKACRAYVNTDLQRNGITVSVRYKLPGGGTAVSLTMNPDLCAS